MECCASDNAAATMGSDMSKRRTPHWNRAPDARKDDHARGSLSTLRQSTPHFSLSSSARFVMPDGLARVLSRNPALSLKPRLGHNGTWLKRFPRNPAEPEAERGCASCRQRLGKIQARRMRTRLASPPFVGAPARIWTPLFVPSPFRHQHKQRGHLRRLRRWKKARKDPVVVDRSQCCPLVQRLEPLVPCPLAPLATTPLNWEQIRDRRRPVASAAKELARKQCVPTMLSMRAIVNSAVCRDQSCAGQ